MESSVVARRDISSRCWGGPERIQQGGLVGTVGWCGERQTRGWNQMTGMCKTLPANQFQTKKVYRFRTLRGHSLRIGQYKGLPRSVAVRQRPLSECRTIHPVATENTGC